MLLYRLPLFLAICLTFLTIPSNYRSEYAVASTQFNRKLQKIAQVDDTNISVTTILKSGDQGDKVKGLQNKLKVLGYFEKDVDGVYDETTKEAVSKFQQKNDLEANGIVKKATWDLLANLTYDYYMEEGYRADKKKDYKIALQNFQKALDERPKDYFALEAKRNVEKYLDDNNKTASINTFFWVLLAIAIVAGVGLGLLFLFRAFSVALPKQEPTHSLDEEETNPPSPRDEEETNTPPSPRKVKSKDNLIPFKTHQKPKTNRPQNFSVEASSTSNALSQIDAKISPDAVRSSPVSKTSRLAKLDIVEELIKDLRKPSPGLRRKAIWELAQKADSRAMQPLVDLMIESNSQERSLVLEAISQIAGRSLKPLNRALTIALQDESSQVRKNAIRDLTRVYDLISQVSQRMSFAIDDPDKEVQETAQWALAQLNQIKMLTNVKHLQENQETLNSE